MEPRVFEGQRAEDAAEVGGGGEGGRQPRASEVCPARGLASKGAPETEVSAAVNPKPWGPCRYPPEWASEYFQGTSSPRVCLEGPVLVGTSCLPAVHLEESGSLDPLPPIQQIGK